MNYHLCLWFYWSLHENPTTYNAVDDMRYSQSKSLSVERKNLCGKEVRLAEQVQCHSLVLDRIWVFSISIGSYPPISSFIGVGKIYLKCRYYLSDIPGPIIHKNVTLFKL